MIIDLKSLTVLERSELLAVAGNILRHIPFPAIHPDRPSSGHYFEIAFEEDLLQNARRRKVESQGVVP